MSDLVSGLVGYQADLFVARNQRLPMDYYVVVRDAVAELVDAELELVAEGEGPEEDEMADEDADPAAGGA